MACGRFTYEVAVAQDRLAGVASCRRLRAAAPRRIPDRSRGLFYSLAELNIAIGELLRQLDDERPIRRLGATRQALFEEFDRPNLKSLPAQSYSG